MTATEEDSSMDYRAVRITQDFWCGVTDYGP